MRIKNFFQLVICAAILIAPNAAFADQFFGDTRANGTSGSPGNITWSDIVWYDSVLDGDTTAFVEFQNPPVSAPSVGDTAWVLNPNYAGYNSIVNIDQNVTVGSLMWIHEGGSSGRRLNGSVGNALTFDTGDASQSMFRISGRNDGQFVLRQGNINVDLILNNDLLIQWTDHERFEEFNSMVSGTGRLILQPGVPGIPLEGGQRTISQGFRFGLAGDSANTHAGTEINWRNNTPFLLRKDNVFGNELLINADTNANFFIDLNGTSQTVFSATAFGAALDPGVYTSSDFSWLSGSGSLTVAQAIPEPSTGLLAMVGTVIMASRRRRNR